MTESLETTFWGGVTVYSGSLLATERDLLAEIYTWLTEMQKPINQASARGQVVASKYYSRL